MADNSYTDIMEKNHMEIPWHDYARQDGNILIDKAGLIENCLLYTSPSPRDTR